MWGPLGQKDEIIMEPWIIKTVYFWVRSKWESFRVIDKDKTSQACPNNSRKCYSI